MTFSVTLKRLMDCRWANACNYQTTEKKHLISHLRSHLDWRPFSCEICGARFKHEHEIRRHIDKLHQNFKSDLPSAHLVSPTSYSNHSGSVIDSPQKAASLNSSLSPTFDGVVSESDSLLLEIIEYALGIRESMQLGDEKRMQLIAMGIHESAFFMSRPQLRRNVLDGVYQKLFFLGAPERQTMAAPCPNQADCLPNACHGQNVLVHPDIGAVTASMGFNSQQLGFESMLNPYGNNVIPQNFPEVSGSVGLYTESLQTSNQLQEMAPGLPIFPFRLQAQEASRHLASLQRKVG
ncbi:hypothetical protein L0F63_004408 [Massospora cicadina]|nr:hypothetical protein L0F63_004408 [Massospora cicadina]